jgi:ATP-binding cassette subfamily B protein
MSIGCGLLLMLGEAAMDLLKPWPLKLVFDSILRQGTLEGSALYILLGVSLAVVGIAALEGLFKYVGAFCLNRAGRTIVFDIRSALFDHIQRLSLQFHDRRSTGDLLTRVTSDVTALRQALTESLAEVVHSCLVLVGMAIVLLWLDWPLALVAIGASPLLLLALVRYTTQIRAHSRAERRREGTLASVLHEALGTVRQTRVFSREEEASRRFRQESEASLQSGLAATLSAERFSWVVDVLAAVVTGLVLGIGVQRVMAGAITPGTLIIFVTYTRNFYKPLRTAVRNAGKITRAAARAERVAELLDVKEGITDLPGARPAPRFRGEIRFRGARFEYEPGRPVLDGIDLTIPARQTTAIVGPTGAGKSTLVALVPRLFDPTEGAVLIDGRDIRAYTLRSLRSQVSVVLQESVLLRASIAENIGYGRPSAGQEEIVAAAEAANAHDFIMALPRGYETEIGERGETLSGGQRQRIAIARAMVRDAPIVILDEPLTGLDATSAAEVMDALKRLMRGKTVLIITHHLAFAQRADQVVVLADGQIVQRGTHRELVDAPGPYRRLFEAQFKDVLAARA